MPRTVVSDMPPHEFRFLREYLGFTTKDIAEILKVQNRTVQAWDKERNASIPAKELLIDEVGKVDGWIASQLKESLLKFAENGGNPVMLRLFSSLEELQRIYPMFRRINHYEAALRGLVSVLSERGIKFYLERNL